MKKLALAAALTAFAAALSPVSAATPDCYGGYKTFLGKVSPHLSERTDVDLATLMRRGLSVYDACMAGDSFSPHGVWDQIAADIEAKSKKK